MPAMASSLSSFCGMPRLIPRRNLRMPMQARAQSSAPDEGKSSVSIVNANLGVLKERIEILRMEKRLERCRIGGGGGWSYQLSYDSKLLPKKGDKGKHLAEFMEVAEQLVGQAAKMNDNNNKRLVLLSVNFK